ncbi:MAG: hypothetical protein ACLUOI_33505 [Eisenbergiella sp.]
MTGQRSWIPCSPSPRAVLPPSPADRNRKTMTQHQIAKWSNADIIIYRLRRARNEMTQVLEEFSELVDPRTGNLLMDRPL